MVLKRRLLNPLQNSTHRLQPNLRQKKYTDYEIMRFLLFYLKISSFKICPFYCLFVFWLAH